jgi:fused signal recognition particle receptor
MGEPNRILSVCIEELAYILSRVEQDVPVHWLWAGLGMCILLFFGLFVRNRMMRRKARSLEENRGGPEPTGSGRDKISTANLESGRQGPDVFFPGEERAGEEEKPGKEAVKKGEAGIPLVLVEDEPEESFFSRLKGRLVKTQNQFTGRLDQVLFRNKVLGAGALEELEEVLVTADLGVKTSYDLLAELQKEIGKEKASPDHLREVLKQKIGSLLAVEAPALDPGRAQPFVVMIVGVNGVGKTTTAGKLAARLGRGEKKVMLVAADTFRPAAIEQLQTWSERVGADFIKHQPGADPSAVVFDAMGAAQSRKSDLVLVDTAGRLHTKKNLMEELKKVKKIMGRELEGAPHEILLVLDATTGQNAIHQARIFHESLGVTGLVLTKLDGTAKGGMIVGISNELRLPVRFIGIGEQVQDLQEFKPSLFLNAMFGDDVKMVH